MKYRTSIIGIFLLLAVLAGCGQDKDQETGSAEMRVGWMTAWADGGLVAEVLKRTDVMEKSGVDGEMVPFLYGPPMVEAALTGEIDVLFVGWVPAVSIMSNSDDWIVVSRLVYFPMELLARNGSGIEGVADLKGRKIGVPYATGPYPLVVDDLRQAGLDPGDVELINIKPADLSVAIESGNVDAIAWAEPALTILKDRGVAYPIREYRDISFIVVSKTYAENNREQVEDFLKSVRLSQYYVARNKEKVFGWFSQDSKFDLELVRSLKMIEPNFEAKSLKEIDISISDEWIEETQKKIDFEYEEGMIDDRVELREKIDTSYLEETVS